MKVLVYTRPRIQKFFYSLIENVPAFEEVKYFSDHRGLEDIDLMCTFYEAKEMLSRDSGYKSGIWDFLPIGDVISRCRFLRSLKETEARLLVKAMAISVRETIDAYEPDYIFGMVMDSYVLDICDRIMRSKGRQYIGFLNNMLNGYSRLTSRGELVQYRQPDPIEVNEALSQLRNKYYVPNMQSDFVKKTSLIYLFVFKYLKEKIKIVYYFLEKLIKKDPDSFYANTVASPNCMSCRRIEQIFYKRYENQKFHERISQVKSIGKRLVYLPLQFYPECSIDYWGTSREFRKFNSAIFDILSRKYNDVIFLVKEHPSAFGLRSLSFYKSIVQLPNVILAPFDFPSNSIIPNADIVITWTGSVGIEALVRRKPLITLGKAYYDFNCNIRSLDSYAELRLLDVIIEEEIVKAEARDWNEYLRDLISNLLAGLVPGYIFPLDYETKSNPSKPEEMRKLGESISETILFIASIDKYEIREGTY